MINGRNCATCCWVALFVLVRSEIGLAGDPIAIADVKRAQPVVFEKDILPILQRNCLACHSLTEKQGDLVLESAGAVLKGGDTGPAAIPGRGTSSLLLKLASHQEEPVMPPDGNDVAAKRLTSQELGLVKLWIDQGARGSDSISRLSPAKWRSLRETIGPVYATALTPDGQFVATSRANQLFLYHVPTGSLIARLSDPGLTEGESTGIAHRDLIQSLAISVDGDLLASGSFREVKLWRRPSDVVLQEFKAGTEVTASTVSSDGQWMATAGTDHVIRLWKTTSEQPVGVLKGHTDRVTDLRFDPSSRRLVSSSLDGTVRLWDPVAMESVGSIETPLAVNAVAFVAQSAVTEEMPEPELRLVTGGAENLLRTWRIPGSAPQTLDGALPQTRMLVASPDRKWIAQASVDGTIRISRSSDHSEIMVWKPDHGPATAVAFLIDSTAIAAAGNDETRLARILPRVVTAAPDGSVSLWSLPDHRLLSRWSGASSAVTAVAATRDGQTLASGHENGVLTLWQLSPPEVPGIDLTMDTAVSGLKISPSGQLAAAAGVLNGKPVVRVIRLDTGKVQSTVIGHAKPVTDLAFSADSTRLLTGSSDKSLRVWNIGQANAAEAGKITELPAGVTAVAFSPDGNELLAGLANNVVGIWKTADGMLVKEFAGHAAAVSRVGYLAANQPWSLSADQTVRFWNPTDGAQARAISIVGGLSTATISRDGQKLAITSQDKLVRIYQLSNGQVLQTLTGHAAAAVDAGFSADGMRLASLTAAGELIVWDVATQRILEIHQDSELACIGFGTTNDRLLSGTAKGRLVIRPLRYLRHLDGFQQALTALQFHSSGQTVFASGRDGTARGFSISTGQQTFAANHGAPILGLAVSPNEQVMATAGENSTVRLWQTNGAAFGPQQIAGLGGAVSHVEFSVDGNRVLAASETPPMMSVFDLQSGSLRQRFSGHQQKPTGLLALPESLGVLSADTTTLRTWEVVTESQWPGHSNHVTSLAAVPGNPMQVVSGSLDATIRRWNLSSGQQMSQFNHGGPVTCVAVRADGQRVASASQNGSAKLWNINGQQIAEMRGDIRLKTRVTRLTQQQTAAQARVNAAKQRMEAAEKDVPVKTEAEKKTSEALAAANKVVGEKQAELTKADTEKTAAEKTAIELSKAAQTALLSKLRAEANVKSGMDQVTQLQLKAGQLTAAANAAGANDSIKKAATDATAAVQTAQKQLQVLQTAVQAPTKAAQEAVTKANQATQKVTQTQKPYTDALAALEQAQSDQNLASQQQAIAARELESAKASVPRTKTEHQQFEAALQKVQKLLEDANKAAQEAIQPLASVCFSPSGNLLATAGAFANVHTWDAESGTAVAAFEGHTAGISSVRFVNDSSLLSSGTDQSVRVWDLNPGWRLEQTFGGTDQSDVISHRVTALDFSSDSRMLLAAGGTPSRNGELMVFSVADGTRKVFLPQAHDDVIYAARFSPDAKRIATASADKYIRIFEVESSEQLRRLEGHTNYVLDVSWKGDGSTLASASADNTVKIWNAETGDRNRTITNFAKHVTAIRYIGQTDNVVSSCGDRTVRMHTATNGGNFRNFGGASTWLHCVDITPDSSTVVAGSADGRLFVWNGANGQALKTLEVGK